MKETTEEKLKQIISSDISGNEKFIKIIDWHNQQIKELQQEVETLKSNLILKDMQVNDLNQQLQIEWGKVKDLKGEKDLQLFQLKASQEREKALREGRFPSDESIKKFIDSTPYYGTCTHEYVEGLEDGIKWIKQLLKQTEQ